ncbi:MAG: hypothetical protein E7439_03035 [Ruminococcaceae bacterium]|nr:hypothetical protein [Oscillospiraceae bacterium]
MRKGIWKLGALCLAVLFLLTGCLPWGWEKFLENQPTRPPVVAFGDMEYTRQDVDALAASQQEVLDSLADGDDAETLMEKVFAFYEEYNRYYTCYALANIYYSKDITDSYWEGEYSYCLETSARVDALLDQMLYDLAASNLVKELESEDYFGQGFFDDYQGKSIWDETFTALVEEEAMLQSKYYALSGQASEEDPYSEAFLQNYGVKMADVFVELVRVRQEMAAYAGYSDYQSFAYDFYFGRDYTPGQAMGYLEDIREELVSLYQGVDYSPVWNLMNESCTESQTYAYVRKCAKAMGGKIAEAFALMDAAELYDISESTKKYDASFETYLTEYNEPYIFVNPQGNVYDKLTFTHEFGHFCNDYASFGTSVGVDVAEIFSQGMEYLSLCYVDDKQDLTMLKMIDCLNIYVEQAAYASFEHQVYDLEGWELTRENVYALYDSVGQAYGLDTWGWNSRTFVLIPHFFISPMYVVSYVVSNDAALQLYQLEVESKGAGLKKLESNLDTMETQFLGFVDAAGLESPFKQGRIQKVRKTLEDVLG